MAFLRYALVPAFAGMTGPGLKALRANLVVFAETGELDPGV